MATLESVAIERIGLKVSVTDEIIVFISGENESIHYNNNMMNTYTSCLAINMNAFIALPTIADLVKKLSENYKIERVTPILWGAINKQTGKTWVLSPHKELLHEFLDDLAYHIATYEREEEEAIHQFELQQKMGKWQERAKER